MNDNEKYAAALKYASEKHEGQFRKGGEKYIVHPIAVAEYLRKNGYDIDTQICGLFHDLLEDTDATEEEILALSNEKVLKAVKLLTKRNGYVMVDYVAGIKGNEMAKAVKTADRLNNLQSAFVTGDDFKRQYIIESAEWYFDLSPEIRAAAKELSETLETPLTGINFE